MDHDYDSQGLLIPCMYTVLRIDSYTLCDDSEQTELVAISSHRTKVRKGENLLWTKVPLPPGTKLTKMTKDDEFPSDPPSCESGVQ